MLARLVQVSPLETTFIGVLLSLFLSAVRLIARLTLALVLTLPIVKESKSKRLSTDQNSVSRCSFMFKLLTYMFTG
jgi:energy-converting hydrogenase Eha subunit A